MSEMGEAADWVALHAALAWVATRDSQVFQRAIEHPTENLYVDVPWEYDQESAIPLKEQEAWLELRSTIMAGTVRARAFPYQEKIVAPTAASGRTYRVRIALPVYSRAITRPMPVEKPPDRPPPLELSKQARVERNRSLKLFSEEEENEDDVTPIAPPITLPISDINNLILGGADKLRPADWAIIGGQAWHSVVISRVDLASAFPFDAISDDEDDQEDREAREAREAQADQADQGDEDKVPKEAEGPSLGRELAWKGRLLREVIKENWPKGIPPMAPHLKKSIIEDLIIKKRIAEVQSENLNEEQKKQVIEEIKKITVGASTINTAVRDIKKGK